MDPFTGLHCFPLAGTSQTIHNNYLTSFETLLTRINEEKGLLNVTTQESC